jgi:hypothetical protein
MGGGLNKLEPTETNLICGNPSMLQIFEQAGWMAFFSQLQGYNDAIALEFSQQFHSNTTTIQGLIMEVTQESISQAVGLLTTREHWFKNKVDGHGATKSFLRAGEKVVNIGEGVKRETRHKDCGMKLPCISVNNENGCKSADWKTRHLGTPQLH